VQALGSQSFAALWGWRAATGFFLAGIYPVGMKIAAQWFPQGLGPALGLLVGALVLGTASPHALRALGCRLALGLGLRRRGGGLGGRRAAGHRRHPRSRRHGAPGRGAGVHLRDLSSLWTDRRVRASVFGYFGHMWELYTVMVLVPA
jgi:DHA1 family inner membrane transport protein